MTAADLADLITQACTQLASIMSFAGGVATGLAFVIASKNRWF